MNINKSQYKKKNYIWTVCHFANRKNIFWKLLSIDGALQCKILDSAEISIYIFEPRVYILWQPGNERV